MLIPILIKKQINHQLIYNFIWNSATDKVHTNIFMQKICNDGNNMYYINAVDKSIKTMWVKSLLNENNNMWKGYTF